jgi:hypothetical protein
MNDAFVAQNFSGLAKVIAHVGLAANPIKITTESFAQIDFRDITRSPNRIRPADEMSHFSRTKFAINLRRDSYPERVRKSSRA